LIGIICFFIISLILSTIPGQIYLLLWVLIGLFTIYFIRLTFPDVWNYIFWLLGIFVLNFLGMIALLPTRFTMGLQYSAAGFFVEIVSLLIAIRLIIRIKGIRDDISGVTDRPDGMERVREGVYIPLGLWAMAVIMFWLVSNISVYFWFNWSVGGWGLELYYTMNIILLISVVYILWHPQMNFDWGIETILLPSKDLESGASVLARSQKIVPKIKETVTMVSGGSVRCPVCGARVVQERRSCPNCGRPRTFSWCKINEGFVVTCPHCKEQTSYGKKYCINCGKPINRLVRCTCGVEHEINDWEFMGSVKKRRFSL
jgi:hypothetical protein